MNSFLSTFFADLWGMQNQTQYAICNLTSSELRDDNISGSANHAASVVAQCEVLLVWHGSVLLNTNSTCIHCNPQVLSSQQGSYRANHFPTCTDSLNCSALSLFEESMNI